MTEGNPWFKFYPSDWRADQALRVVSLAARGLWIECMCIMHEAKPYGHLVINGRPVTDAQLAVLAGTAPDQIPDLIGELETAGVFSRTGAGVIYSRRMTRDDKKARTARKNGKSGGNPSLCSARENPALDNRGVKGRDNTQKPEARIQNKPPPTPPPDPKPPDDDSRKVARAFAELRAEFWPNEPSPGAPAMTVQAEAGQWLAMGAAADLLIATLRAQMAAAAGKRRAPPNSLKAYRLSIQDAVATAAAARPTGMATGEDPRRAEWRVKVESYRDTGFWADSWGAKPGEKPRPGQLPCQAPADLVTEVLGESVGEPA